MAEQGKLTAEQKAVVYEMFREAVYRDPRLGIGVQHKQISMIANTADIPLEAILSARIHGRFLSRLPGSLFPEEQMRHIKTHHEMAAQNFVYRMLTDRKDVIAHIDRYVDTIRWLDTFVVQLTNLYAKPEATTVEFQLVRQNAIAAAATLGVDGQGAAGLVRALEDHLYHAFQHMPNPEEAARIRANRTGKLPVRQALSRSIPLLAPEEVQRKRSAYMESVLHYKPIEHIIDHFAPDGGYSTTERVVSVLPGLEPLLYKNAQGGNKAQHALKEEHLSELDILHVNKVELIAGRESLGTALQLFGTIFDRALEVRGMTHAQRKEHGYIHGRIFTSEEHHAMVRKLQKSGAVGGPVEALEYIRKAETKAQSLLGVVQGAGHLGR